MHDYWGQRNNPWPVFCCRKCPVAPYSKKKNRQDMLDRIMQEKQLIQQLASSKVLSAVC